MLGLECPLSHVGAHEKESPLIITAVMFSILRPDFNGIRAVRSHEMVPFPVIPINL